MSIPDRNIKILVVDDMSTMRRIIKTILGQLGYRNVDEAEDGEAALKKLKNERYDFVITDWNMPKMTGLELVKKIRSDENLKKKPVLMVTAEAKKENVIAAIKAGVNNYIVKPFTPDTLKKKLDDIFSAIKGS